MSKIPPKVLISLIIGLFLLGTIGAMTLAWKADMSQKSVKTDVVTENVDDGSITVDIKSQQQGEHIVCCNEGHFKDAFKHLKNFAEVKDKTLKAPGGPMLIAMANGDLHEDLQAPKRVLIEVLKRHSPKRIVLVAHEECLIYDSVGAWQNEPERVRALQLEHLRQAKSIINEWFPKTEVEIYYGEKVGETQLRFYQVIDDPFFDDSPEFSPLRLGESQDSDSN